MQEVIIEVTGLDKIQEDLSGIECKLNDTAPLMAEISNHLKNIVEDSFENQKSPDGKVWSPIKKRASDPHPEKILYANGDMQRSLYNTSDKDTAQIGFNAVAGNFQYPLTHQFGTDKAGRNRNITIEARPFMPIHEDGSLYDGVEDKLVEIVEEYLEFID